MKRNLLVIGMVIMMAFISSNAFADEQASGVARVTATIAKNVSLGTVVPQDAEGIQTGDFTATVSFGVSSNSQTCSIGADASALYKGDVPTSAHVIPVNTGAGVLVAVSTANATDGNNTLVYSGGLGAPHPSINGPFPMESFTAKPFENTVSNMFVDDVFLTVTWTQDVPALPTGTYSGWVRLRVMTI